MPRRNERKDEPEPRAVRIPLKRQRLMAKTEGHCYYCGIVLTPETLTADHVVPLSRGGLTTMDNLVPACARCNTRKGDQSIEAFRRWGRFRKKGFYGESGQNQQRQSAD